MILLPLTPTTPVLRKKASYEGISPENGLSLVRELTARQQYLDALDLAEQLYREHPQEAVRILAWTYDSIYRILRGKKSRYWLYQVRYFDFQIQPEDKVLDIGSGHMPFPFATHLADYAIEDSRYGRAGEPFEHVAGKPVIQCSIEKMPFADREFDFVYCSHVLEHTENPETACRELMRVAKRGYIEMPTKGKDVFFDTARVSRHRWSADILNRCLVLTEYCPEELKGLECDVLGRMVYAPKTEEEKAFSALQFLKADVLNVMLYWEESFAYEVRRISKPTVKPASPLPLVSASGEISPPASGAAPRFSFVMIVLNGMPFIQYSLKSIYDFAYEIIIVEGAVEKCMFAANPDGSSKDGTVEFLRQFPDPARKIRLIQGRWPEKCEMQNEALRYVTGDYVWLIDSDEVYKREHLEKIKEILQRDPSITQVNFIFDNFWKGLNYLFVSEKFFEPAYHCRRVFRYKPGAVFTSHRPPTLQWPGSTQTTEQMRLLDGHTTRRMGIIPSHYSYVTREQVHQKIELYRRYGWGQMWNLNLEDWYEQCFLKWTSANRLEIESRWPVWTGDPNSHTEPFTGTHPEVMIEYLIQRTTIRENGQETILMKHVVEAAREIKNFFKERPLQALETGTIRTFDEEMHFSTYFLAKELEGHGNLTTVDTSPLSIKRSQNICYEFKNITYVLSDSRVYLSGLKNQKLHLVFLDSANDAEIIFQEFACVVPLMAEGGILLIDDAGILPDGTGKDRNTAAQKGHRVWEFLRACGAEFTVLPAPGGRGTQLKLVMHCQNSRKIKSYLNEMCKSETENQTQNSNCSGKRLKVAEEHVKSGMMIQEGSAFAEAIGQVIREYRPKKILETGTYLGQGTTAVIAEAMKQNGIDGTFFTIEVNPRYHAQAKAYLESRGYPVQALCGLSIPRRLLPSREQIQQTTTAVQDESLFVDHPEPVRVQRYYQETDFPDVPDDLLGKCLAIFDGRPDLVLLDSAGHLGWIEFQYVLERLKGPCILALDDIDHIKHHRSFQLMQKDSRFEILVSSNEKFGFCIARFDPQRRSRPQPHPLEPKHILWLRPDAIGDGILSSAMLPRIRRRFPSARLTVFVQQAAAPLYEACPFVDEILCFQPEETEDAAQFLHRWSQRIWTLGADCLLHSVYSRQFLMDGLVYASGISERIGMEGDCCNIHPEKKAKSDGWYTRLIPSDGDWKPELERHGDFLRGLGCDDQPLKLIVWLTAEDEAYAHKWLEENQINPEQLVVLFAGARVSLRHYEGYGKALEETVLKHRLTVVALGAKEDFEINQRNLDWLKERGIRTFNLCGRLSLRQSAAILKQCRLAVGAETGLAHMAAAVEVPHVVVIGGGHFGRFMPYSPKTTLAALPLDCYGCNWLCRYEQERNYCIQDLQPAVLSEAVRETFEKSSSKPRIFIQDPSSFSRSDKGPAWKLFNSWIDIKSVELVSVSVRNPSTEPTEKKPAMQIRPVEFSIVDNPDEFTYSKKRHFELFQSAALELYGRPIDPATCDLKNYQDLLVFEFIKRHVPKGARILDVGGGNSRILNYFYRDYECWNIDPLEGVGSGPRQLDPRGRYKLVQDYMGKFNPQLPNDYFDFVFSISALEHAGEDAQTLENIRNDINRVLKPGGYSFHLFDCIIKPDRIWIHKLMRSFFTSQTTANRWVEPESLTADPDLYTMTKAAYESGWVFITKQPYETFGKHFSYNVLWQKTPVPSAGRTVSVRSSAPTAGPSSKPQLPKITVVTPSYNQAPYVEACIQSVLSQNYPNLEYIIMDGGSTDGSVEIIKKYEKYLTYWQSKPDGGQYAAVEEGFRRSTGEILTWINSDDMLLPGALRKAAAIFLNRPDVQWITGKVCTLEADGTIQWAALAPVFWNRAKYLAKDYKYIQQEGSFWRRQLWEKAGAFLWKESRLAGDLELWNRFFRHADLYTAEAFLGAFRMQPNRKTASLLEKYNQEAEAVLEAELQQYASQPAHSRPPLRKSPPPITELEISRYLEVFPDQQPSQPVQIPSSGNFLVSAIVSTYNAEAFIRGCLQDLVEQTLFQKGQMEILVVDSGSQQNEGRIVRQFQACYPNIRYLRTPQRETIYAAWNRAIRMASGKYLTSANTDDRHRPDALEILAETLEKNPKIALVYSDQVIAPIPLERFSARWGRLIPRPDYSYERLLFGCCVGSQPMWRKSLHKEFGLFDETLTVAGDWDFWLRIAARYPFQRVPEFLGVYYNNPASAEHGRPIHSLYERYLVGKRYGNPHISIIPPCVRKDNPLVSVILPVYNGADYIAEAIESVLIQNYPYWELLIINDGSEDNTEEIVKRFSDERIQYFLQNHGGPSAARNEGIRRSKGQFLVMLDHDDYLTADHIGQMLTAYDCYPEADLIYCDTLLLNEEGKALRVHQRQEFQNPNYLIREIFQAGFPIIPFRTCIRRRVFEKIGEYDPSLWVAEDYDMWRRFLKQGLIFRHWPKSYYCRRIRRNAHSRIITPEKARMHFEVLQRYLETFEPEQLFPDADWKKWKGPQQEFVFHYLAGEAFAKLAEQYKQSALSPILIQMACQAALEQADFCESIYPQQPFVIQLCRQCEQMLAGVGTETILQEAVAE